MRKYRHHKSALLDSIKTLGHNYLSYQKWLKIMDPAAPQVITSPKQNYKLLLLCVGLIIIGFILGLATQRFALKDSQQTGIATGQEAVKELSSDPIAKTQTATLQGTITNRDNNTITVKDDQGNTTTIKLASNIAIYKQEPNSPRSTVTYTPVSIELQKKAVIQLTLMGNEYQVSSISYSSSPSE